VDKGGPGVSNLIAVFDPPCPRGRRLMRGGAPQRFDKLTVEWHQRPNLMELGLA
jgi:hypothetical protein